MDQDLREPVKGVKLESADSSATTDSLGEGVLTVPDRAVPSEISASHEGYESLHQLVDPKATELTLVMKLMGVVEGPELKVEKSRPGQDEQQSGTILDYLWKEPEVLALKAESEASPHYVDLDGKTIYPFLILPWDPR